MMGGCGGVQVAQAVLVPLLVDKDKVGPSSLRAIKSMMVMQPPPSFQVRCSFVYLVTHRSHVITATCREIPSQCCCLEYLLSCM